MNTDDLDEATRLHVYRRLVESSRAPTLSETASALNVDVEQATGSLRVFGDVGLEDRFWNLTEH